SETRRFIDAIVWHCLKQRATDSAPIRCIVDACRDEAWAHDLVVLNHDTTLDFALADAGLDIVDGFGPVVDGLRHFDASTYDREARRRHSEPHGAISWIAGLGSEDVTSPGDADIWHTRDGDGELRTPRDGIASLLVGTTNKQTAYATGYT